MQGPNYAETVKRECAGTKVVDRLENTAIRANDIARRVLDRLAAVLSPEGVNQAPPSAPVPNYPYPPYFGQIDDHASRINEALSIIDSALDRLELP